MEFKFLKLRDLQGKTPSFPAAGEVHITMCRNRMTATCTKQVRACMIRETFLIICVLTKVWYAA